MLTPQTLADNLAKRLGLTGGLYFKREALHPLGSHKGRSIPLMIKKYAEEGRQDFVISSSGNAALAAGLFIKKYNRKSPGAPLSLKIFAGKNMEEEKMTRLNKIQNTWIKIQKITNPKQRAFQMEKSGRARNLRQSTDDAALAGYEELARELAAIKNLSAVFAPTSSGTTAQGLYEGFKKLGLNPQIHIVQTEACHPIADAISNSVIPAKVGILSAEKDSSLRWNDSADRKTASTSIASAIVDKVAHRKNKVAATIKNSAGGAWVASDEEIFRAMRIVKITEGINVSPNSALSVAGLVQALQSGRQFTGPVVCLLTGR